MVGGRGVGTVALTVLWRGQRQALNSADVLRAQTSTMREMLGYGGWDVGVRVTTDEEVRFLNEKYRGVEGVTDVLSFPYHEAVSPGVLPKVSEQEERNMGDIILAGPLVAAEAEADGVLFEHRLPRLVAHGLCHLVGYTHDADNDHEVMLRQERQLLEAVCVPLPENHVTKTIAD